ncbi:MAG: hypothetical protein LQ351_005010 [Letrouitia transgressa]|nr:MAG: hypothetical protein LQ351_005010 [Letrouitia transgressa]
MVTVGKGSPAPTAGTVNGVNTEVLLNASASLPISTQTDAPFDDDPIGLRVRSSPYGLMSENSTKESALPEALESFVLFYRTWNLLGWTNRDFRQNPLVAIYIDQVEAVDRCDTVGQEHRSLTLSLPAHQISTMDHYQNNAVRPLRLDKLPCRLFRQPAGQYQLLGVETDILIPASIYQGLDPSYRSLECKVRTKNNFRNIALVRPQVTATGWEGNAVPVFATASPTDSPASRLLSASPGSGGLLADLSKPRSTLGPDAKLVNTKDPDSGLSPGREGNRPTFIEDANRGPLGPLRQTQHIRPMVTLGNGHTFLNLIDSVFSNTQPSPLMAHTEMTATDFAALGLPSAQGSQQTMTQPKVDRIQSTATGFLNLIPNLEGRPGRQQRTMVTTVGDVARAQITATGDTSPLREPMNSPSSKSLNKENERPGRRSTLDNVPLPGKVSRPVFSNVNRQTDTTPSFTSARKSLIHSGNPVTALEAAALQQPSATKDSNAPIQAVPGNPTIHLSPPTVGQSATGFLLAPLPVTIGGQSQELVPNNVPEQTPSETPSKNGQGVTELPLSALPVSIGGQSQELVPIKIPKQTHGDTHTKDRQSATRLPLAPLPVTIGGQSQELVPNNVPEQTPSETPSKNGQGAPVVFVPTLRGNREELPNPASAAFPAVTVAGQVESLVPVSLPGTVADQVTPQPGQSDTIPIAQGTRNANPMPNQGSNIPALPEITVGGQREQLFPVKSSEADVGSRIAVAGSVPPLVAGKPVSLGQSALAVGRSFVPLRASFSDPAPQSQARIGGTAIALNPTAIPIAGTILSLGGPAVTVDNTPISLGRMGLALGSSTLPIPNKRPNPVLAVGSETLFPGEPSITTAKGSRAQSTMAGDPQNLNPLQFSIAGTRLSQGGPGITLSRTPISLGSSGLVVGEVTLPLAAPSQARQSPLTVAGQVFTPNPTGFPIADTALSRGGPGITLSGTPISLGSSGLVVGEATLPIATSSQASQSPLTIAGQVFTPNPTAFPIADTALSRGGPGVTLSGTPISLGPSGLVVGKTTLPLAAASRAAQAPLTLGGQVFTPNPSASPIAGTTLSRGGPGITISQTPVSLGASGLVIGSSTLPLDSLNSASLAGRPSVFSVAGSVITRGGPPITVSGTRISLGASGLVVGTRIVPLSAFATPTAATTPRSGAIYSIGGTRITQGGPAITISGTRVSLGTKVLVIGSSTIPLPSQDLFNAASVATSASTTDTGRSFESSISSSSATALPTEPSASSLGRPIPPVVDNDRDSAMPFQSAFPPLAIPKKNLVSYIFQPGQTLPDTPIWIDAKDPQQRVSPRQTRELILRLGAGLDKISTRRGQVVMIFTPNHVFVPAVYMGIVGTLRIFSGANPTFTRSELAYQLKDTGAQLLLAHPSLLRTAIDAAKDAGLSKEQVFQFSDKEEAAYDGVLDWRRILASEEEARGYTWPELSEEEATKTVATINYSSGTTGLPKGVCISHHNIISNVEQSTYMVQRKSQDARRWIGLLPLYHAYGQLYTCLIAPKLGIPVFIMQSFTFEDMLWTIATHRITNLHVAPPIMVLFAKRPEVANYDLSSLTEVASGAAPLSRDLQREVSKRLGVRVQQGWGMTEITCAGILTPGDSTDESGSVGMLIPNVEGKIIDNSGNEVRKGEQGELLIRGPNVCLEYWRNEAATRETKSLDGWLKTGDVAIMKGDWFWIVDRKKARPHFLAFTPHALSELIRLTRVGEKELIKVKGFQVAPAELEAVLLEHESVADAAVVGVTMSVPRLPPPTPPYKNRNYLLTLRSNGQELPRAYISLKPHAQSSTNAEDIHAWIAQRLAKHKHFAGGIAFVGEGEIPKSPSGKILRKVMREWAKRDASDFRARL